MEIAKVVRVERQRTAARMWYNGGFLERCVQI